MGRIFRTIPAATIFAAILVFWCSCGDDDDKSIGPSEPKEYYVYFDSQNAPGSYWRYHTGTGDVERFELPYNSMETGFAISPDGKYMYLYPDGFLVTISLDSLTVIAEEPIPARHTGYPFPPEIRVSASGRYLVLIHRNLNILDLTDHTVVYTDSANYYSGNFCGGMDIFLTGAGDSLGRYVLEVDLRHNVDSDKTYFTDISPVYILPDHENTKWFIMSPLYEGIWHFNVYDREMDSIIFTESMCPGPSDMVLTPDGKRVAYCQVSPTYGWDICQPVPWFTIYSIENNIIEREVGIPPISIFGLCVTPDGRHVIGAGGDEGILFDYDPVHDVFYRFRTFGRLPWSVDCQRSL